VIRLLKRLFALFFLASACAHAAPLSPDPTGFWYNPNESGWGVNVAQQGEVLFVTVFVYDEQKRPQWFVASSVKDTGNGVFSGTLYRTSGPTFGGAFDPNLVQDQAVGTLTLQYAVNFGGQASLQLGYTVNGVAVTKGVTRLTWDSNATRLPGAYFGGMNLSLAPLPQVSGCTAPPAFFTPGSAIRINMSAPDSIFIIQGEGIDVVHIIGGTYQQSGQFGLITGGLFSGIVVNPMKIADAQVTNLVITDDGFSGHLRIVMDNCIYEGPIGGIRR